MPEKNVIIKELNLCWSWGVVNIMAGIKKKIAYQITVRALLKVKNTDLLTSFLFVLK
jgi:hypothetical protein